jgi:hypothetical protein
LRHNLIIIIEVATKIPDPVISRMVINCQSAGVWAAALWVPKTGSGVCVVNKTILLSLVVGFGLGEVEGDGDGE